VFDPCWLDQARRWSCDDVARRPRTPPVRSPSFANPLKSDLRRARQGGDRGFESISLQPSSRQSVSLPLLLSNVENPAFRAGLGSWFDDGVSRDAPGFPLRQPAAMSLPGHIPVPQCR